MDMDLYAYHPILFIQENIYSREYLFKRIFIQENIYSREYLPIREYHATTLDSLRGMSSLFFILIS